MSIKAVSWALEQSLNDGIAKLILIGIADRYNDEYGKAWPSIKWLATTGDCSERTVTRKLNKLEEMGLLEVERRFNETNVYKLPSLTTGVTLSGGDTAVSGGGDRTVSSGVVTDACPINNNNNNNNNNKYRPTDLVLNDELRKYATDLGLDADDVYEGIVFWYESQTKKKTYASLSAFWKGWCRREAKRAPRASNRQQSASKVVTKRELSEKQKEYAKMVADKLYAKHAHEFYKWSDLHDAAVAYLSVPNADDAIWTEQGTGLANPFN